MRIASIVGAASLLLAACDLSTEPAAARLLPPLASQVWMADSVDGQPLPRVVAQRQLEGDVHEYDILDALYVTIDAAGTWEQRAVVRRFRDGELHEELQVVSKGTWAAEPSGYVFATEASELGFIIADEFTDSFTTSVRIDGVAPAVTLRLIKAVA